MKTLFPPLFCLTLPNQMARQAAIKDELAKQGIEDYEFFYGVDHNSNDVISAYDSGRVKRFPGCFRCGKNTCGCENNVLIPQQVAVCLSFQKLFEQGIEKGYEVFAVCEDDIVFREGFKELRQSGQIQNVFNSVNLVSNTPTMIRLGAPQVPKDHDNLENLTLSLDQTVRMSNYLFVVNRAFAKLAVERLERIDHTADMIIHDFLSNDSRSYSINPQLVWDRSWSLQEAPSLIHPKKGYLDHLKNTQGDQSDEYQKALKQFQSHKKRAISLPLAIIGLPTSNPNKTLELLKSHGIIVSHQNSSQQGVMAWQLAHPMTRSLLKDKAINDPIFCDFQEVYCYVENPVRALDYLERGLTNSLQEIDLLSKSVQSLYSVDITRESIADQAALLYVYWSKLCMDLTPGRLVRECDLIQPNAETLSSSRKSSENVSPAQVNLSTYSRRVSQNILDVLIQCLEAMGFEVLLKTQQETNLSPLEQLKNHFIELTQKQNEIIQSTAPLPKTRVYSNELDKLLNNEYGFKKSFEKSDSIDADGNPIPWMTYSAIYYLNQLDLTQTRIFEWGSGNSSLYFSSLCKELHSIESNPDWYNHIKSQQRKNSTLSLKNDSSYAECIHSFKGLFDIISIDGDIFRRLECAFHAIQKLKPGGIIVLDNSDWLQNTCDYLRELGFNQIDFSGAGPINNYTWCTSIFFRGDIAIPSQKQRPQSLKAGIHNVRDLPITQLINQSKKNIATSLEFDYQAIKQQLPTHSDIFCSQEGEDILIKRLLKAHYEKPGFYVDVGAHHPVRFSNTYHYYLKGWQGINIDPIPGTKNSFDCQRPRDLNLECAIGDCEEQLDYYQFQEPAFNTLVPDNALSAKDKTTLTKVTPIPLRRLDNILDEHLPKQQAITFLSIDVEGLEISVLRSSNWKKYRPYIICIEALNKDELDRIDQFMEKVKYQRVASTKNSQFYCENSFWREVK